MKLNQRLAPLPPRSAQKTVSNTLPTNDSSEQKTHPAPLAKRKTLNPIKRGPSCQKGKQASIFNQTARVFSIRKKESSDQLMRTTLQFPKFQDQDSTPVITSFKKQKQNQLLRVSTIDFPSTLHSSSFKNYQELETRMNSFCTLLQNYDLSWHRLKSIIRGQGQSGGGQLQNQLTLLKQVMSKLERLQYQLNSKDFKEELQFFSSNVGMKREYLLAVKNSGQVQREVEWHCIQVKRYLLELTPLKQILQDIIIVNQFYDLTRIFLCIISLLGSLNSSLYFLRAPLLFPKLVQLLQDLSARQNLLKELWTSVSRGRLQRWLQCWMNLLNLCQNLKFEQKKEIREQKLVQDSVELARSLIELSYQFEDILRPFQNQKYKKGHLQTFFQVFRISREFQKCKWSVSREQEQLLRKVKICSAESRKFIRSEYQQVIQE